jgi:transcriptional regulator with GAF, ATPase, and Fis domain
MSRLNILPDPRLEPFGTGIQARLQQIAALVDADNFADLLTPLATALLLDAFERVGAHEGTVWLVDQPNRCLIPAFNNGPDAEELRKYRQPLDKGLVSMVFANEQPFVMNRDRSGMDPTLMQKLKQRITAQIIVPLYFLGECRGVVSCVQIARGDEPEAAGFEAEALRPIKRAADALRVIIDSTCLTKTLGITL